MKKIILSVIAILITLYVLLNIYPSYEYKIKAKLKKETSKTTIKPYDWAKYEMIAHGLGGINQKRVTESKEAFEFNYKNGKRVLEADLIFTKDGVLVARHDWLPYLYNMFEQNVSEEEMYNGIKYSKFKSLKINKKYTPLSFEDLCYMLKFYDDAYLVLDTKDTDKSLIEEKFNYIVKKVNEVDPYIMNRVIPQFYNQEMYNIIKKYNFKHYIYTLYQSKDSDEQVIDFMMKNNLKVVTMPQSRANKVFLEKLNKSGIKSYVHTINDDKQFENLKSLGVWGIYTDFL